ncbi:sulfurtransferase [Litchfieldella qijiaojingensis]|uniref:Sulfurtransferase n=1 Tax=Litchfieldella qijiaojingensis TaxID=980347 RepID=A0ABQ2ZAE4_9GAMM|nr:sulfurtransferase [Halomonas qijiaojingensis]GGY07005.1 sulfurtransferase [Halomonas qijiaojingensis]
MFKALIMTVGLLALASRAVAADPTPLVEAKWLNDHLGDDDLVVLDVRSGIDDGGDRDSFEQARIPGSIYSSYTDDGWRETRDDVVGLLPPVEDLEQLIGGLGIGNDDTVVIVPAGTGPTDFGSAARVYWTFKVLGHDQVAILNGGFAGWQQQGYEVASGTPAPRDAVDFEASLREELIATTDEVEAARESQAQLVDARPVDYFRGDTKSPVVRVAGTIPGSINLPHHTLLQDRNNAFYLDSEGLQSRINEAELDPSARTVSFCNTAHWAATDWFVLSEIAGFDNVTLYDGSMAEWTISDSRPVETVKRGLGRLLDFFN